MTTDIFIAIAIGMSFVIVISVFVVRDLRNQERMSDAPQDDAHSGKPIK